VLTFIPGDIVFPDQVQLVMRDEGLVEVARLIRRFHDAILDFDASPYQWSDRGSSGDSSSKFICHNDLAPWNLVRTPDGRFVFIDWDLAAPGPRSWDLSWALLTFVPLMPGDDVDHPQTIAHRLALFRDAYGSAFIDPSVIDVAVTRCQREANLIKELGGRGEPPFDRLLAQGHLEIWSGAADHVESHRDRWKTELT
jgi:hypothetical protein